MSLFICNACGLLCDESEEVISEHADGSRSTFCSCGAQSGLHWREIAPTMEQVEGARQVLANLRAIMPAQRTGRSETFGFGGSGRWENQAYPSFYVNEEGDVEASYRIYGDQDDPYTTDDDVEKAVQFAQDLLDAADAMEPVPPQQKRTY